MSVPFYDPSLLAPLSMDGSLSIIKKLLETNKPLDEENVEFLETSLAKIHSADFCLAVGSGTDALTIALRALELPPGTGVAVPGFSFVASASCILENQLIPFFVDVSPHTALCNPHHFFPLIEKAQVGAIIVPHLFGQIVELQELYLRAKRKNIYLIEDAAQAFGSTHSGLPVGHFSDITCFSFDPQKILSGFGSGGALMTRNEKVAYAAKEIRNYGFSGNGHFSWVGLNSRLHALQGALLLKKLEGFPKELKSRQNISHFYRSFLSQNPHISLLEELPNQKPNAYRFVLKVRNRDAFQKGLLKRGIESKVHYPFPIYHHPPYRSYQTAPLPGCEELASSVLSLPSHPRLTEAQIKKVVEAVTELSDPKICPEP